SSVNMNHVEGNYIGTDFSGTKILAGGKDKQVGVGIIFLGSGNDVAVNLISGNSNGVELTHTAGSGNRVYGNRIGLDATGSRPLDGGWGNTGHGVYVLASGDSIGDATQPNYIGGNAWNGISIETKFATNNIVWH